MTIEAIIDEIQRDAELVDVDDLTYEIGRLKLKENQSPPRIVWIPIGGSINPTDDIGGRFAVTDSSTIPRTVDTSKRFRQLRTDAQDFEVHIWHKNIACVRALMHRVVAATWRVLQGSVDFGDYTMSTQDSDADYARFGQKVELELTMRIPILETDESRVLDTTDVTTQTHQVDFVSDLTGIPETIC